MRPALSQRWNVGDRFRYNRWSEQGEEGCVFVITKRTAQVIYFRSPVYDRPEHRDRRMGCHDFYKAVERRLLVRER
jgi:hypothetical protein